MATWRRRAIQAFPELRGDLNDPDYTITLLFFDLLSAVRDAHRADDQERLRAIYEFAHWCAEQSSKLLWNAAGVAFYEHLFDERWMWEATARWLTADVRSNHAGLWAYRLSPKDFAEVERLLARTAPRPA